MQALLGVVLPVFLVIGFGYAAAWRGVISPAGIDGMMKFAQGIAIPCLLFLAIATLDLRAGFDAVMLGSFYGGALCCFAAGLALARLAFGRDWEDAVAVGFICLFSNSVLLGLPVTERAYGPQALTGNFAIIALHAPVCYGIGITAMELVRSRGRSPGAALVRVVRAIGSNALMLGIGLGFVVNLSGLPLPGVLAEALEILVRAALPVALFGLGAVLWRYRPEGDFRLIACVCAISLVLHPAFAMTAGRLAGLDQAALRSAVVTAAMAPGVNAYLFADLYGRARRVAASSVLLGTAASVATVWVWLALLG